MEEDVAQRLFKIKKTLSELLNDRGYEVSDEDLFMTFDQFVTKYGPSPNRVELTTKTHHRNDTEDKIYAFFPKEPKVGVANIREFYEIMLNEQVKKCIMIVRYKLSPQAKQAIRETSKMGKMKMELFQEEELMFNITNHMLVPRHILLSQQEKIALLKKYKLKDTQLPRLLFTDPVCRYYAFQPGQVIKIIRPSMIVGTYVSYRIVV